MEASVRRLYDNNHKQIGLVLTVLLDRTLDPSKKQELELKLVN